MRSDGIGIATLALQFAGLSLFAVGGINAAVPEMHRELVELTPVLTDRQFTELFALAQAAPGPNVMFATLIGYQVAGLAGASAATLAICGPSCALSYIVGRLAERYKAAPWRVAVEAGLVPISLGLIAATALILARSADRNWVDVGLTLATAAVAMVTRLNPLWMLGFAALLGIAGWA